MYCCSDCIYFDIIWSALLQYFTYYLIDNNNFQNGSDIGPVRLADKPGWKVLFADLLWEKNIIPSLKKYGS